MLFLFLGLAGLLIAQWSRRAGVVLAWFGMLGLLLLAVPAVATGMYMVLEWDLPLTPPPDAPPQAIVILSGDISRSGTDTLLLQPGPLSLQRESAGADLYRRTHLPILISGGSLREDESPLASVMADSMEREFQVPVQWQETRSECHHPARARHPFRLCRDPGLAHAARNTGVRGYRDPRDRRADAYRSHAVIAGRRSGTRTERLDHQLLRDS
jgi:uncharacterized SAM-binding protein YcdF (DUF218 family)